MKKALSFAILVVKLSVEGKSHSTRHDENVKLLMTTLYEEKCVGNNFTRYLTPINLCYNGINKGEYRSLMREVDWSKGFRTTNPYGENDILDTLISEGEGIVTGIRRSDISDSFPNLPLNSCIGPFGEPLPWGTLELVTSNQNEDNRGKGITSFLRK